MKNLTRKVKLVSFPGRHLEMIREIKP